MKDVTTDVQLQQLKKKIIPYFRGIFMCTTLSIEEVSKREQYRKFKYC